MRLELFHLDDIAKGAGFNHADLETIINSALAQL